MTSVRRESDSERNSSGISPAVFFEDIEYFIWQEGNDGDSELLLAKLEEQFRQYKFTEMNLSRKEKILKKQIPDIKASLDMLNLLKLRRANKETINTHFMISDDIYVKASIPPTDEIVLWVGANIMLEYELGDAAALLRKNLESTMKSISQIQADLDFLREQLTITEVNMARVYNWDINQPGKEVP